MRPALEEGLIQFQRGNKNSMELLFKDVKHFDVQNPVIGSLIKEVDIGKKKDLSKFVDKAPDIRDLEIQSRLNKLRGKSEFFNRVDNLLLLLLLPIFLPKDHHLSLLIY